MAKVGLTNYKLRSSSALSDVISEEEGSISSGVRPSRTKQANEWKKSYHRRSEQLTFGLHIPNNRPYKELGVLDNKEFPSGNGKIRKVVHSEQKSLSKPKPPPTQPKLKLRSVSSDCIPEKMLDLYAELNQGARRIMLVKSGQSLNKLLRAERDSLEELKALEEVPEEEHKWYPAGGDSELDTSPLTAREQWRRQSIAMNQILNRSSSVSQFNRPKLLETLPESPSLFLDNTAEDSLLLSPDHPTEMGRLITFDLQNQVSLAESKAVSFKFTTPKPVDEMSLTYRFLAVLDWIVECTMIRDPTLSPSLYEYLKLPYKKLSYEKCVLTSKNNQRVNRLWQQTLDDPMIPSLDSRPNSNTSLSPPSPPNVLPSYVIQNKKQFRNQKNSTREESNFPATIKPKSKDPSLPSAPTQSRLEPEELEVFLELLEMHPAHIRSSGVPLKCEEIKIPNTIQGPELDVADCRSNFNDGSLQRSLIVHEQLAAMDRARLESCKQKFEAIRGTSKLSEEINRIRKAVVTETAFSARHKLLMNYRWFEDLLEIIPPDTKYDRYCLELLDNLKVLAETSCKLGPSTMSRFRLVKVLSTLAPTDLGYPEVDMAISFVVNKLIYVANEDFANWKTHHRKTYETMRLANK